VRKNYPFDGFLFVPRQYNLGKKVKYGLDFKSVSDVRFTYTYQGSMMKDLKLKCGKNVERFKPLCH
jgi:hypothetical protein